MKDKDEPEKFEDLPDCAVQFIRQVIKKMRYRKKIRQDVQAELVAHFEDELKDSTTTEEKEQKAHKLIAEFGDPKLLAVLMRRAKKRCRPLWKKVLVRGLQVLGIIFLYLLACLGPLAIGRPNISVDYIGWLNELVQAGRDEENNAMPYYEKAVELYVEMPDWLYKSTAKWPTDFNDVQLQVLVSWLNDNQKSLEALREAAERPYSWRRYKKSGEGQLVETLMPNVMEALPYYRYLAFAMRWQIRLAAYNGDVESALKDCVVLQKCGDHLQGQGLLIEQLVGVAMEALALDEISRILRKTNVPADFLRFVQDELAIQFKKQKPIINLEAEKVFWYDQIQRTFTDNGQGDGHVLARGLPYVIHYNKDLLLRLLTFRYPSRREVIAEIDEYFEQVDQLFEEKPWDLHSKDAKADKWNHTLSQNFMLNIQSPAYRRISQMAWRLETHRRGLLTLLAIMRYQKNEGQYPENLSELVSTRYMNNIPIDPFSGRPLVYRNTEDGFILYSVGMDFKDDGGRLGLNSRGEPRMWADDGDWVFWPRPTETSSSSSDTDG